ncbi:MAG TPA: tetratricopeptide repeat protein [Gemmataceae bacterium]|jgi:serine/threonine protein kinase/Flp pilus assembly protein TadD|nr:tetratricopeptide repeat protein [Gemmataceae bacterium]
MTASVIKPSAGASADAAFAEVVEELTAKFQAREPLDVEAYVAKYPEHAEKLRQLWPALQLLCAMSEAGASGLSPLPAGQDKGPEEGTLGDFQILREIGRGGMGVVYEAEQISLGRRVALKVLPLASTLDPRRLQRFHNEAKAAACLHHTNIVPVFAVGSERGVHFYAMQLIDGVTLAAALHELRQRDRKGAGADERAGPPTTPYPPAASAASTMPEAYLSTAKPGGDAAYFRKVAELGAQAASALDYAHQMGVVHRDIKPGNLMLDGRGNLWITDFGLAQLQADAGLTMTGDLLGTLRYMSPEQALAKRVLIDHRTDVYSLGVTLYELLALRPAFVGEDRQELLRQVAFEEPALPRRLNKAVPRELETVVLKAMEKNPAERYGTAQELADDLRRLLDDRPILARRPSPRQMVARWARRHRPLVWAVAVMLLVATVLGSGTGIWRRQQKAAGEREATAALEDAERLQKEGKLPEALWAIRRAEPLRTAGLLNEELARRVRQRQTDLEMVNRLDDIRMLKADAKGLHWDNGPLDPAYEMAFQAYGIDVLGLAPEEAAERMKAKDIRRELAAALQDWALACKVTRPSDPTSWKALLTIARAADPDDWRNQVRDALEQNDKKTLIDMASSVDTAALSPTSVILLGDGLRYANAPKQAVALLRKAQQQYPGDFWINYQLSYYYLWTVRPIQPEESVRYGTGAVAIRPHSPGAHLNLGCALHEQGRLEEAKAEYLLVIELDPAAAAPHNNLGNVLRRQRRPDEAENEYREAIELDPRYSAPHIGLGGLRFEQRRLDESEAEFREAVKLDPNNGLAHTNLANALKELGRPDKAEVEYREAIRLDPTDAQHVYHRLGMMLQNQNRHKDAEIEFRKSIEHDPNDSQDHANLGISLHAQGRAEDAEKEFREAVRLGPNFGGFRFNLGNALYLRGQFKEAEQQLCAAIELDHNNNSAYTVLGLMLLDQGRYSEAESNLGRARELLPQASPLRETVSQALTRCRHLQAMEKKLHAVLEGKAQPTDNKERIALAYMAHDKKLDRATAGLLAAAFADDPKLANDLNAQHRYNAACSAALAAAGQGEDAPKFDDKEKGRLRDQALTWLQADQKQFAKLLEDQKPDSRAAVQKQMEHWQSDRDLAGVRGEAIAKLPEAERQAWLQLWADVADTLSKARDKAAPDQKRQKNP